MTWGQGPAGKARGTGSIGRHPNRAVRRQHRSDGGRGTPTPAPPHRRIPARSPCSGSDRPGIRTLLGVTRLSVASRRYSDCAVPGFTFNAGARPPARAGPVDRRSHRVHELAYASIPCSPRSRPIRSSSLTRSPIAYFSATKIRSAAGDRRIGRHADELGHEQVLGAEAAHGERAPDATDEVHQDGTHRRANRTAFLSGWPDHSRRVGSVAPHPHCWGAAQGYVCWVGRGRPRVRRVSGQGYGNDMRARQADRRTDETVCRQHRINIRVGLLEPRRKS